MELRNHETKTLCLQSLLNLRRPARNYCLLLDDFAKNYRASGVYNDLWL